MNAMRYKTLRSIPLLIAAVLASACSSTHTAAPIVDRTLRPEVRTAVPVTPAVARHMDSQGYYTVRKGDTLLQIALEFGQNYRDLVAWNNLANPNDIRVDQVLRVAPPTVSAGAPQAASVNTAPAIEVRPLNSAAVVPPVASALHKAGPRGDKQPYSEAALVELQKPDTPTATAATSKPEAKTPEKVAHKMAEPAPTAGAEDSGISWEWPAEGKIIGAYDESKKGIDIGGKAGQPIVAASGGKVMYAGSGIRGYGNLVIVKHTNNLLSAYAHNKTILVKEGQSVNKGEKIAEMGNSDSDAVKLHFEIRQQGKPVDPSKFLPSR
jgi:lipoprotein NlpD